MFLVHSSIGWSGENNVEPTIAFHIISVSSTNKQLFLLPSLRTKYVNVTKLFIVSWRWYEYRSRCTINGEIVSDEYSNVPIEIWTWKSFRAIAIPFMFILAPFLLSLLPSSIWSRQFAVLFDKYLRGPSCFDRLIFRAKFLLSFLDEIRRTQEKNSRFFATSPFIFSFK